MPMRLKLPRVSVAIKVATSLALCVEGAAGKSPSRPPVRIAQDGLRAGNRDPLA